MHINENSNKNNVLYHGTDLESAYKILSSNKLLAITPFETNDGTVDGMGVSLTRDKKFAENWGEVVLVLDSEKLRQRFPIRQVSYPGTGRDESEEFVGKNIENLSNYLIAIYFPERLHGEYLKARVIKTWPKTEQRYWKYVYQHSKYNGPKPITIKNKSQQPLTELDNNYLQQPITWGQLNKIEQALDKVYRPLGIDIAFTKHFADRANDPRNIKPITAQEIVKVFADVYRKHAKTLTKLGDQEQAVMTDLSTMLNIPFVMRWDPKQNEFALVAKTVMRKSDFKSPDPKLIVEKSFETADGIRVLDTPTQDELLAYFRNRTRSGYMKGVVIGNKIYWWDAYYGTHAFVSKSLGIDFNETNYLYLSMRPKHDPVNPSLTFDEVDNPDLIEHPAIQRLLKNNKIVVFYAVDKHELNEGHSVNWIKRGDNNKTIGFYAHKDGFPGVFVIANTDIKKAKDFTVLEIKPATMRRVYGEILRNTYNPGDPKIAVLRDLKYANDDNLPKMSTLELEYLLGDMARVTMVNRNQLASILTLEHGFNMDGFIKYFGGDISLPYEDFHGAKLYVKASVKPATLKIIKDTLEKTFKVLKSHGLERVFGGNIRIKNTPGNTLGLYYPDGDDMVIDHTQRDPEKLFKTLLHEYAHRYENLFMSESDMGIVRDKFNEMRNNRDERIHPLVHHLKPGDKITYLGKRPSIIKHGNEFTIKRVLNTVIDIENDTGLVGGEPNSFTQGDYADVDGNLDRFNPLKMRGLGWFPTAYSQTEASEWFAELFAYYLLDKLSEKPKNWLKGLLK